MAPSVKINASTQVSKSVHAKCKRIAKRDGFIKGQGTEPNLSAWLAHIMGKAQ